MSEHISKQLIPPGRIENKILFLRGLKVLLGSDLAVLYAVPRALPYAFTEHGVAMLSSVLRSERAVQVNIAIMRAFVQLRAMLATHEDLRRKITEMEKRYDGKFHAVFATIRQMLEMPSASKREIGFHAKAALPRRAKWAAR